MKKLLLQALLGEPTSRIPFWFMRQAGRYLPEYRELRASTKGFLDLCFTPDKAAEITLQPLRRFQMDAAILFSDILVIPLALGVDVRFEQGEGPIVAVTDTPQAIAGLRQENIPDVLAPIAQTVRLVAQQLPAGTALIGFAGSPWTVACYMLQGTSGKEFQVARQFAYAKPDLMQALMDALEKATITYLRMQIDAGAEAIQLFDSWAGLLTPDQFARWSIAPTQRIVAALKQSHPQVPVIGFAKGAGLNLPSYAKQTGVQGIGVDQHMPMPFAVASVAKQQAVQGNLDPLLLASDKDGALAATDAILQSFGNHPAIFNVGHGFIPQTPIAHVEAVAEKLKAWRRA